MNKFLKWAGIILGGLIVLLGVGSAVIYVRSQARLDKVYIVPEAPLNIPSDAESIARGRHIFQFRGCEACHSAGENLGLIESGDALGSHFGTSAQDLPRMEGNIYLEDPAVGRVTASNLTSGTGGVAGGYTDQGWINAIRHGVRADGTPLLFMPSTEFYYLSDEDLGAVIAYIKSAPPVDNDLPASQLSFTGRVVMTLVPDITFLPAELIPHDAPRPAAPGVGITAEYGEYLTYSCKVCHGPTMSGGDIPGLPASWPPAPNLTFGPGSALPAWTEDGFINTLRTGISPEGRTVRAEYMPWGSYKFMSDDELKAVWVYLQSLPKLEHGNR